MHVERNLIGMLIGAIGIAIVIGIYKGINAPMIVTNDTTPLFVRQSTSSPVTPSLPNTAASSTKSRPR